MAAQYVAIKRISSLDTPITAEKLDGSLFTTENQAHEFIVSVRKNGVKQTVTGSVSGKFIRANGTTIFLQGSIVDGDAVVRLHQDCYNVQGRFTFNIFNTQSGVTTCIYSAVGKMDMGSTETVIDAGDVVPDISDVVAKQEEMTQVIADARTATTAANTAAQNVGSIVARPYSPPYETGEHCTQNGNLYEAKQDIPTDEEWTASHWTQTVLGDEVTGLKSALHYSFVPPNDKKINVTDTTVTIPSYTRLYYGAKQVYRVERNVTINRVATPDANFSEEVLLLNPTNGTFRFIGGNAISDKTNDELIVAAFAPGSNGCSLSPFIVNFNNESKYALVAHADEIITSANAKINITSDSITIPNNTRIVYNKQKYKRIDSVTISRVNEAYSEVVVLDLKTNQLRCVATANASQITADEIVLFSVAQNYACSLSPEMVIFNSAGRFALKTAVDSISNTLSTIKNKFAQIASTDSKTESGYTRRFIKIHAATIEIPGYTRIFFPDGTASRTGSSPITVDRITSDTANQELLIVNKSDMSFRCIGGSNNINLGATEYIVAVLRLGSYGSTLPDSFVEYEQSGGGTPEIVSVNGEDETLHLLSQITKNRTATLSLLHFSDIHGDSTNINRILNFRNYFSAYFDDIIHTGDTPVTNFENADPFATVGGADILNIVGNHDYWHRGSTWPYPYDATQQEVYEKFISPHIDSWGVVSAGTNKNYWYKDYTDAGIRLIGLDSINFDADQKVWFESTLESARTAGLKVVCADHYPPQTGLTLIPCKYNHVSKVIDPVATPEAGRQIERLIEEAYTCVDTFVINGGEFICWICGHTHGDFIGTVTGHTNQIVIIVTCGFASGQYSDDARVFGTKSQDAFNCIALNAQTKEIRIVRIGSDRNGHMQSRKVLYVNYQTKQVYDD